MPAALRYVVLRHEGISTPHFDFMLEPAPGAPLRTWRLAYWPIELGAAGMDALPDHRPIYLEYEGPLSNDRGSVRRIEAGTYRAQVQADDPCTIDLWLDGPPRRVLRMLTPPAHPWTLRVTG